MAAAAGAAGWVAEVAAAADPFSPSTLACAARLPLPWLSLTSPWRLKSTAQEQDTAVEVLTRDGSIPPERLRQNVPQWSASGVLADAWPGHGGARQDLAPAKQPPCKWGVPPRLKMPQTEAPAPEEWCRLWGANPPSGFLRILNPRGTSPHAQNATKSQEKRSDMITSYVIDKLELSDEDAKFYKKVHLAQIVDNAINVRESNASTDEEKRLIYRKGYESIRNKLVKKFGNKKRLNISKTFLEHSNRCKYCRIATRMI